MKKIPLNWRVLIYVLALCGTYRGIGSGQERGLNLVPWPVSVEVKEGVYKISGKTEVVAGGGAASEGRKLVETLEPALGLRLRSVEKPSGGEGEVELRLEPGLRDRLGGEGYEFESRPAGVTIRASDPAGLFYGIQTFRQLLPAAVFGKNAGVGTEWAVPCVRVVDYPRFEWRGLLIDPARHFIPVTDVKQFIEVMAFHKFNRLQIHLTDDQGWRIEIKKYPKLVGVGAWMDFTVIQRGGKGGGYYSQDDIRHLVRYGAERHVTIVPEIEMPAHTGAAIVAYPELSLNPEKVKGLPTEQRWRAHEGVIAPRPRTVAFMQDVLREVIGLFPSRHIHIGGDEANIDHWKKSAEMQELIRGLGLKDELELHSWFIKQMDSYLTQQGRQLVGWDEILQGGLAPGAVVMSWRGEQGGINAAQAGHDVVMAPTSHTYFDYYQGPAEREPKAIGGFISWEKVYSYEPIPEALRGELGKRVLGGQAQLWGEFIATQSHRFYMTYPRAAAMAEVLWSKGGLRDLDQFRRRLEQHMQRLKAWSVAYRDLEG